LLASSCSVVVVVIAVSSESLPDRAGQGRRPAGGPQDCYQPCERSSPDPGDPAHRVDRIAPAWGWPTVAERGLRDRHPSGWSARRCSPPPGVTWDATRPVHRRRAGVDPPGRDAEGEGRLVVPTRSCQVSR